MKSMLDTLVDVAVVYFAITSVIAHVLGVLAATWIGRKLLKVYRSLPEQPLPPR